MWWGERTEEAGWNGENGRRRQDGVGRTHGGRTSGLDGGNKRGENGTEENEERTGREERCRMQTEVEKIRNT